MRLEAAEHLVAHGLPIFRGMEVLQVEPVLERVLLDVQQRGLTSSNAGRWRNGRRMSTPVRAKKRVPYAPKSRLPASSM